MKNQKNGDQINIFSLKGLWKQVIEDLRKHSFIHWSGLDFRSKNRNFIERSF